MAMTRSIMHPTDFSPASRPAFRKAIELAKTHGWFLTRQFENEANPDYHSRTTAREIIDDFKGEKLDYWVTGYGTGGTLKGVARVLAKEMPATKIIVCEPEDAQLLGSGAEQARNPDGSPAGYTIQTAEKTYANYTFTVHNRGGHSSEPRKDNAIYSLAHALDKLEAYRFQPMMNETTRAYFEGRQKTEKGLLGDAMRRWLANPNDGEAADIIEASESEVGLTRTRCVATRLDRMISARTVHVRSAFRHARPGQRGADDRPLPRGHRDVRLGGRAWRPRRDPLRAPQER